MLILVITFIICITLGFASVHSNVIIALLSVFGLAFCYIGTFVLNTYLANNEASIGFYESQSWPLLPVIKELFRLSTPEVKVAVVLAPLLFLCSREGLRGYYFFAGRKPRKIKIF